MIANVVVKRKKKAKKKNQKKRNKEFWFSLKKINLDFSTG
jgi:hypothetical protein